MAEELVVLKEVAQDGVRVRASAGSGSFRRKERLGQHLDAAREQVRRLAEEREHRDPGVSKRERAARERAGRERVERVERALEQMPLVEAAKERQVKRAGKARGAKIAQARVSTTDPEARVMKMADGPPKADRPAYNVQLATDVGSQVIVGVGVINRGTDQGEALAVEEQVVERTKHDPDAYLMDGGYVDLEDIQTLERQGIKVYAPPKESDKPVTFEPGIKPELMAWRERMETDEGKAIYRHRASTAECVNALARARYGVQQFRVRGLSKVTSVALVVAITHNLMRWAALSG